MRNLMGSNHLNLQSKSALGGAGNRTQIETGQHRIRKNPKPQRHVLPLLEADQVSYVFKSILERGGLTTTPPEWIHLFNAKMAYFNIESQVCTVPNMTAQRFSDLVFMWNK
jgi:hypothetical protein